MDSRNSMSEQIMPNMCVCIRWDLRLMYCILVCPGRETSTHYFLSSGGTDTDSTKNALGHVMPNMYF
jgi:hypothetical protein